MKLGNQKYIIVMIIIALLLGIAGFSFAADYVNNGDIEREKSVRIQDVEIWVDASGQDREGIITEPHYAQEPFNIYLFVTNPGHNQNIIVAELTTFHLTLLGPEGTTIDLGSVTIDGNGLATVSPPISVTIPFGGDWQITATTPNGNYGGGGGQNGGTDPDPIIIDVPIMIQPTPILVVTPQNTAIKVGESASYTARVIYPDSTPSKDVTAECTWTGSNTSIAISSNPPGTFLGIAPGTSTITAKYGGITRTASLTVAGSPHHLAIVPLNTGDPLVPKLNIRPDTGPSTSTWGYIGESMNINVALQMQDVNNNRAGSYLWDSTWFSDRAHWGVSFTSVTGSPSPSQLEVSVLSVYIPPDNSVLKATLIVTQKASSTQNEFNNFRVQINPIDKNNISLTSPTTAFVCDSNGAVVSSPYNLYGGRIKVFDNYFNTPTGAVNVSVEMYHNGSFITNTADSRTSVDTWLLDADVLNNQLAFAQGKGKITVTNGSSNTVKLLTPSAYPSYLETVTGKLTWGQIIINPPTEGTLWEVETPINP